MNFLSSSQSFLIIVCDYGESAIHDRRILSVLFGRRFSLSFRRLFLSFPSSYINYQRQLLCDELIEHLKEISLSFLMYVEFNS
jgi:hypothetical protein